MLAYHPLFTTRSPTPMRLLLLSGLTALVTLTGCEAAQRIATDAVAAAGSAATVAATRSDARWDTNAAEFRDQVGRRFAYVCPPRGVANTVWGVGPYTDDSSVCTAAVHAGALTFARGGRVVIEMRQGQSAYDGGRRNGVEALSYGAWGGSFAVLR